MSTAVPIDRPEESRSVSSKPTSSRERNGHDDAVTRRQPSLPKRLPMKSWSWSTFWARCRYVGWCAFVIPVMVMLYMTMIAEGIRIKFAFWAVPLYKLKWMPKGAERYDIMHRWDLAVFASVGLLFLVWRYWDYILQLWIVPDDFRVRRRQRSEIYKRIVIVVGVALILFDAYMFYIAMSYMGWGGKFSATALLATVGYSAALIAVALITLNLRQDIHDSKEEDQQ